MTPETPSRPSRPAEEPSTRPGPTVHRLRSTVLIVAGLLFPVTLLAAPGIFALSERSDKAKLAEGVVAAATAIARQLADTEAQQAVQVVELATILAQATRSSNALSAEQTRMANAMTAEQQRLEETATASMATQIVDATAFMNRETPSSTTTPGPPLLPLPPTWVDARLRMTVQSRGAAVRYATCSLEGYGDEDPSSFQMLTGGAMAA